MEENENNLLLEICKLVFFHIFGKILDCLWGLNIWGKLLPFGVSITYFLFSKRKKVNEWIIKAWKYSTSIISNVKHRFIKKEVLLFQSQEYKDLSWNAEIYLESKIGFCFLCQGVEKLDKDRVKSELFSTLKVPKIKLENRMVEKNIVNSFCQDCTKKKIEDLGNNPRLKNPNILKKIKSWFFN